MCIRDSCTTVRDSEGYLVRWVGWVGLCGWWVSGQWILGVMRFQKIFGLYGEERHKVSWIFEKPNLPQNMGVIRLSAFDNFEFNNRDHHFWYTLTQGFPKIYHTYGVSWIFEKPNLPQNMGVIRLSRHHQTPPDMLQTPPDTHQTISDRLAVVLCWFIELYSWSRFFAPTGGRTDGWTKVFQEVLADLKNTLYFEEHFWVRVLIELGSNLLNWTCTTLVCGIQSVQTYISWVRGNQCISWLSSVFCFSDMYDSRRKYGLQEVSCCPFEIVVPLGSCCTNVPYKYPFKRLALHSRKTTGWDFFHRGAIAPILGDSNSGEML